MRIVHVLPSHAPEYGGPVAAAEAWAKEAVRAGHSAIVLPSDTRRTFQRIAGVTVCWPGWSGMREIAGAVCEADLVHVHGLWNIPATLACDRAAYHRKPYVLTPHGMLNDWSLSQSRRIKSAYSLMAESRNLRNASAIHYLNESERSESARKYPHRASFTLPNGVSRPLLGGQNLREELERLYPVCRDRVVGLFLGRLHHKKGLDVLIKAMALSKADLARFILLIAGPDDGGYRRSIESLVAACGLQNKVFFLGAKYGPDKEVLLSGADIFLLTSREEGDSIALKEALAAGLPVLTTPNARAGFVTDCELGRVVSLRPQSVLTGLCDLVNRPELRREIRERAPGVVEELFSANKLGEELLLLYDDILTKRRRSRRWNERG